MRQWMIGVSTGLLLCGATSAMATVNDSQQAINTLQKQIQADSAKWHSALKAQEAATQKALGNLHQQMQTQITAIQKQIQAVQAQLTTELKAVQAEVVRVSGGHAPATKTK